MVGLLFRSIHMHHAVWPQWATAMLFRVSTIEEMSHDGSRWAVSKVVGARANCFLCLFLDVPSVFDGVVDESDESSRNDDATITVSQRT